MRDRFAPPVAQSVPLREIIANAMRRAIVLGELAPGTRLDEQWLADKFGVSRIPIRETFPLLERSGLVRIEPRRGAFVIGVTNDDIHEIYECRRVIECYAVRRVAETIDPVGLSRLRELVDKVETAMRENQPERMVPNDMEFHRQLVVMTGNKRLLSAWELIAEMVAVFLSINTSMFQAVILPFDPIAERRHTKLLHYIEIHDADAAEEVLKEHLHGSEVVILESIKRLREGGEKDRGSRIED